MYRTNLLAQAYGSGNYNSCTYGSATDGTCSAVPGAPNTGFIGNFSKPEFAIPFIIIGAILIAGCMLICKKMLRRRKSNTLTQK